MQIPYRASRKHSAFIVTELMERKRSFPQALFFQKEDNNRFPFLSEREFDKIEEVIHRKTHRH